MLCVTVQDAWAQTQVQPTATFWKDAVKQRRSCLSCSSTSVWWTMGTEFSSVCSSLLGSLQYCARHSAWKMTPGILWGLRRGLRGHRRGTDMSVQPNDQKRGEV